MNLRNSAKVVLSSVVAFPLIAGLAIGSAAPASAAYSPSVSLMAYNCGTAQNLSGTTIAETQSCLQVQTGPFPTIWNPVTYVRNKSAYSWLNDVDITVFDGIVYKTVCHFDAIPPGEMRKCEPYWWSSPTGTSHQTNGTVSAVINSAISIGYSSSKYVIV
ncbi:hypothetical protein [Streptomyces sp. NPDC053431]|uniref:hypothetical protein n=1 Tax=Streptomyces sp. NPDC053431 TaxID=3365703 RepID=UPI0037D91CF5